MKGKTVRWRESPLKVLAVFDVWNIRQVCSPSGLRLRWSSELGVSSSGGLDEAGRKHVEIGRTKSLNEHKLCYISLVPPIPLTVSSNQLGSEVK
jgi:hypothetical protein